MAKLICDDGTEVEISRETEANLREKFGKKKGFEKISLCHLRIQVLGDGRTKLSWKGAPDNCYEYPSGVREVITSLQSAIDYIENK